MLAEEHCYLCGVRLEHQAKEPDGTTSAFAYTVDHIPPKGLFPEPRPANLITVPCCYRCNQEHSGFDDQLRLLAASAIQRNSAGGVILERKVFGSTLAKKRQMPFVGSILHSMQAVPAYPNAVKFSVPAQDVFAGVIRITKGLLRNFYPGFDYERSVFNVTYVGAGEAADSGSLMKAISERCRYEVRGERVFEFWRSVDAAQGRGVWMLAFYEAVVFIIMHESTQASAGKA